MTELTYKTEGDYQLPELSVPQTEVSLGKYGMLRRSYLRKSRRSLYTRLLVTGRLLDHLAEIDKTATEQVERTVSQMAKNEGVTELMKAKAAIQAAASRGQRRKLLRFSLRGEENLSNASALGVGISSSMMANIWA